jgi:hypothetical protein
MKVALTYSCDLEDIPFSVSQMLSNMLERMDEAQEQLEESATSLRTGSVQSALAGIDEVRQLLAKIDHRLMDCTSILAGYVKTDADLKSGIPEDQLFSPPALTQEVAAENILDESEIKNDQLS